MPLTAAAPVWLSLALTSAACGGASPPPDTATAPAAARTAPARTDAIELTPEAMTLAGIEIGAVSEQTRTDQITASGVVTVDETRTARVGSLQEGLVLEIRAQVGDRIRANQLLATMHGHAVHDAWAGYRRAIADRRRQEKELSYAVEAHERARRLYADKAVSLQELQRADADRVAADQLVDMAKAEVTRSIEELEHIGIEAPADGNEAPKSENADVSQEQIPVRSPMGGVVLERLVTPGTTVTPGTAMFVVSDLSTLWVVAEVDESRLARLKTGRPVRVRVAAYPDETFTGTITFIGDVVNAKTRRVTVRSSVPNRDGRLKPEMFATVLLGDSDPRTALTVPRAAVQTIDGTPSVFVAQGERRFRAQAVTLGSEADGRLEITSGLSAGDRVAGAGSFALKSELLKAGSDN
jgi:cobalt-zinc-cadmium efflux system membrane fusion protein